MRDGRRLMSFRLLNLFSLPAAAAGTVTNATYDILNGLGGDMSCEGLFDLRELGPSLCDHT